MQHLWALPLGAPHAFSPPSALQGTCGVGHVRLAAAARELQGLAPAPWSCRGPGLAQPGVLGCPTLLWGRAGSVPGVLRNAGFAQLSLSPSCSVLCPGLPAPKPAEFPKNPTFPCPWGQGLPSPGSATRALQPSMPKPCWRTYTQTWKSPHLRTSHSYRIPTETGSVHSQHHRAWGQGPSTAAAKITPAPACTCSPGN